MILTGALATIILTSANCANGPKYGAAKKHNKSCDCPHWNALPPKAHDVWGMNEENEKHHGANN